jgi:hypothetical protein
MPIGGSVSQRVGTSLPAHPLDRNDRARVPVEKMTIDMAIEAALIQKQKKELHKRDE